MIRNYLKYQEEVLELEPRQHTLYYFKDLFRVQGHFHNFDDFPILEDLGLVKEVDDGLNLLQDAGVCRVSHENFDDFVLLEPVDQDVLVLFPDFRVDNQLVDHSETE